MPKLSFMEEVDVSQSSTEQQGSSEGNPTTRKPSFRLRFGLKTFLAFVMLAGVFFGVIYPSIERAKNESDAISQLTSLYPADYSKPEFLYDYEMDGDDKKSPATPAWVRMILGEHCFSTVKSVRIIGGVNDNVESFEDVVSHLSKFKNLQELAVDGLGYRKDADFFEDYPDLRVLSLNSWSDLEDLSGLKDLNKLESLDLSMTSIRSIASVADCSGMKSIQLTGCELLEDIELVAGMPDLAILEQSYCSKVKSLDYLDRFENLENFGCSASEHVKSFDVSLIAKNRNLKSLMLSGFVSFENIELLNEFPNLVHLRLDHCRGFEQLPSLAKLTKLKTVILQNCDSLKSLHGIGDSGALTSLTLFGCKNLEDITPVSEFAGITSLDLQSCNLVDDFRPVSTMKSLKSIRLQGTNIKDLDMLKGLKLQGVFVMSCPNLADISGLSGIDEHASVWIQSCPKITQEMAFDVGDETGVLIQLF
ncbi:leucine-rich repeat domain-containing protein [Mariniblastus fucicola]|uniref:leucine-rich repeat domain-containing protein n=1 Tax=Mariniblastus fucicola TaxID=980251 RepID=UPI0012FAFFA4|nr:hypothetical protein [Mariniblastus fucicola]